MYIYIHVENYAREFDAKLLLSLLAVEKNTKILLGNVNHLVQKKNIPNGLFHNKDITGSKEIINMFKNIKKNKLVITSQDEEGGIEGRTPVNFMQKRYSDKTLSIVDRVFTFGEFDTDYLKKKYPRFEDKFLNTGTPRFDFYKPLLNKEINKKKYILISSNFATVLERKRFWERIEVEKNAYFRKSDHEEKYVFEEFSHNTYKIYHMVQLVRYLTKKYKNEKFIFRPHPVESIEGWKKLIGKIKNLEVIRTGSLVDWIINAKVLIQSGCYSAIEASLAGTDIITFQPKFIEPYDKYFPSSLGYYCKNISEVDNKLAFLIKKKNNDMDKIKNLNKVRKRLNYSEDLLSSSEIVKIWKNLLNDKKTNLKSEMVFERKLFVQEIIFKIKNIFKKLNLLKLKKVDTKIINEKYDTKFPELNLNNINKVTKGLIKKLNLKKNVKIKQINNHLCFITIK
jgi:surface carbohydrate biosynthesis protein